MDWVCLKAANSLSLPYQFEQSAKLEPMQLIDRQLSLNCFKQFRRKIYLEHRTQG